MNPFEFSVFLHKYEIKLLRFLDKPLKYIKNEGNLPVLFNYEEQRNIEVSGVPVKVSGEAFNCSEVTMGSTVLLEWSLLVVHSWGE